MRLFTNREDIDFTNVNDLKELQEFDMIEDLTGNIEYPTAVTKFKGVHHLCIHFPTSLGEERTRINFIGLKGDFQQRRREAVHTVYESRPVPEDNQAREEWRGASRSCQ